MHGCELITNLHGKKVLCHCAEVPKDFRCCNHRLCFPYCDWHLESFPQKARSPRDRLNVVRPSPFRWGLGTRLSIPSHFTHHHWPILPGLSIPSHFTHHHWLILPGLSIPSWFHSPSLTDPPGPKHSKLISLTVTDQVQYKLITVLPAFQPYSTEFS